MAHKRPFINDEFAGKLNYKVQSSLSSAPEIQLNELFIGHEHEETASDENYVSVERTQRLPVREQSVTDRVEITQQQLSRTMAIALCAGFFIFLVGYSMGKYQVIRNERGSSEDMLSYGEALFFDNSEPVAQALEKSFHGEGNAGHFATLEEADKLCMLLKKRGKAATVIPQSSFTASGREFVQYLVWVPIETQELVREDLADEVPEQVSEEVINKDESENSEKKTTKKG